MEDLKALREQIDGIDRDLLALFARRMEVTQKVGEYKLAHGVQVLDPQREQEVLDSKAALAPDAIQSEARTLFETIMALSRRQQRRLVPASQGDYETYLAQKAQARAPVKDPRVLYQGVPGAYAEEAAAAYFGEACRRENLPSWEDVFAALGRGEADYGVVPIENSSTGSINQVYDLLAKYEHFIVGEVKLRVDHCLMAPPGVALEDIREVFSHEQGLFQCAPYLKNHPGWKQTALSNTAAAARFVAQSGKPCAAIGSERCARLYGLNVLARHIAKAQENYTRFVVVSPKLELDEGRDKISALFTLPHKVGTLHQIMAVFAISGLNMMKLESRPILEKSWEYRFFVDFSGNLLAPGMDLVLREMIECSTAFRVLGNYRSGEENP